MSIMTVVVWSEIKGNIYFQLPVFQKPSLKKNKGLFLAGFSGNLGFVELCGLVERLYFEFFF